MKKSLLLLLIVMMQYPVYAQWAQWRGPNRDGFSPETNLLEVWPEEGPELLWSNEKIGLGYSSAIIHKRVIYTLGQMDFVEFLSALDIEGELLWQKPIGETDKKGNKNSFSTPTYYQGKVYAVGKQGDVVCLDAKTGVSIWTLNLRTQFAGDRENVFCESLLVVDGRVIVTPGGNSTTMAALDSMTGETVWTSESLNDQVRFVSPVLIQAKDKKLIVTMTRNYYLAVDFESGKIVWHEKGFSNYFVPLPGDRQVHFSSSKNGSKMLAISEDLKVFQYKWRDDLFLKQSGGAVKLGDRLFGTYERGSGVFCLDWDTGKQLAFNKDIRGANLLAANDMIYSYEAGRGRISLLKPSGDNIDIVGSFKVPLGKGHHFAHLSIGHGVLYVRHGSVLMAYDIRRQ